MTSKILNLALFQPEIPQNLGPIMRLCACMHVKLHIIEPCGFPLDEKKIKRSAMDYIQHLTWQRHSSWESFLKNTESPKRRLLLMTTKSQTPYTNFDYHDGDILIAGSESKGAPDFVHETVDHRLTIPMHGETRSLNIAISCAMFLGEMSRIIRG